MDLWIGYDPREGAAFDVAWQSALGTSASLSIAPAKIHGLYLHELRKAGLYKRPTELREGRLWDTISDAPMSTEFACSRFLVPHVAKSDWALFMDCDMLVRGDLDELAALADERYAVMCVKHVHEPAKTRKMDNQIQTRYARKNWSSVMVFNCRHPANSKLTLDMINTLPGRDLHRFCWLEDSEIGALGEEWNWLVSHSDPKIEPKIVHFTAGTPDMPGCHDASYADEWRAALRAHNQTIRKAS